MPQQNKMSGTERWQFWIDRGGTFTDVVARRPDGRLLTHKLLSENPERYEDAAVQGISEILGLRADDPLPEEEIDAVKMGTTVATNALLERAGDRTVLLITRGFGDALRIGYQNRPRLFDLHIKLPEMLYERVIEVQERVNARGEILVPLDEGQARAELKKAYDDGIRSVAIVLMHGYRHIDHEKRLADQARDIGFTQVSASHQVSPLLKLVGRGDTTVVDAYLSPVLRRYVARVARHTGTARLMFMQSNGGLTAAARFQGKDAVLSGPAGGVVGMARTAEMAGFDHVIGFDMGGTSTDVSHYAGAYERAFETLVAGVRMRAPMMNIHTVAAGGGSIVSYDGARLRVGPKSAGADPGPACYRRGGPPTITDCNLVLGKIRPEYFPRVFGPEGDEALDGAAAQERFAALADAIGDGRSAEQVAEGCLTIAVQDMAGAIKRISVEKGHDVTKYTLCCFGGAGGQHACLVADALGMKTVLIHPFAGVLSAYGMGLADVRSMHEESVEAPLSDSTPSDLETRFEALAVLARADLQDQVKSEDDITLHRTFLLRYEGTDTALPISGATATALRDAFKDAHRKRFGFVFDQRAVIVEAISLEAVGAIEQAQDHILATTPRSGPIPELGRHRLRQGGAWREAPFYDRDVLQVGDVVDGPAVIRESVATTVLEDGWQAEISPRNDLLLRRVVPLKRRAAVGTKVDPVMLEVFNNLFMSVAEQMGVTLANTAHSVNIKERLDFSCAIFDKDGNLVANAPHVPVHLGSMGDSIRAVIKANPQGLAPGDVYVLNAPFNGGTHLPDVTVVTPVFDQEGKEILFFTGSRGHHADIGGITPGSMPPHSTRIEEEGVLIDNFKLVDQGQFRERDFRDLLARAPWPARNPDRNLADIKAQIAANEKGGGELGRMLEHYGLEVVRAYMGHVQDNAEESVRRVVDRLRDGSFVQPLDNGQKVCVALSVNHQERSVRVDFSGTSRQGKNNVNTPLAVVRAAVLYVFRTLVEDEIPLNEGCLKPLTLIVPEGSMLNPVPPAAVVAGNVETSQAVTDALFGALGVVAASQGTMNNLTFGNDRYQYYETLCGGAGAGPEFDGASAVHTHMTNSRLTDPEVLEWRFPVVLEDFCIRRGSGGAGLYHGGNGVLRRIRMEEAMEVAILSNHRRVPPYGLAGGEPGRVGRNVIERVGGRVENLGSGGRADLSPGDKITVETPGGGGFGRAETS